MESKQLIELSSDEALVLFEMLARFEDTDVFSLQHNAEFLVLSRISGQLQKSLVEPFKPDYDELVSQARARLSEGFEGLAPAVSGSGA